MKKFKFYAPTYLEKVFGKKIASEIEDQIIEDWGLNGWDNFTSMTTKEDVDSFLGINGYEELAD